MRSSIFVTGAASRRHAEALLQKEAMKEEGIPMLILDGDGIDKRNNHDGQIKTRLEAFLEMLEGEEE